MRRAAFTEKGSHMDMTGVKLTELVEAAGCAAKLAPGYLSQVLADLPRVEDPKQAAGAGCTAGVRREHLGKSGPGDGESLGYIQEIRWIYKAGRLCYQYRK